MKFLFKAFCYFLILVFTLSSEVIASGTFITKPDLQATPTESRAAIYFDGKKETILDSLTFNVNPLIAWNFAWLIAVPSKPEVDPISDELFPKLEKISAKGISKDNFLKKLFYFDIEENTKLPSQLFTRPVNLLQHQVFEPNDNQISDLNAWLEKYGYVLPKASFHLLEEYKSKGWYFIISEVNVNHLQLESGESLTIPGAHILPIKISFKTDKIIYPLKLTSVQPDYDSKDITLGYEYGLSSDQVLGEKDEKVDDMLKTQSKNIYPQIPLDYTNLKTEIFLFADRKYTAKGFDTIYANWKKNDEIEFVDFSGSNYLELPKRTFLTRLVAYQPMMQLEDVTFTYEVNNRLVNDHGSIVIQFLKFVFFPILIIFIVYKYKKR
jgi:hypothetical protein